MENVVLIVHLLLALTLIGVVLLQRSEGGGLGIGGGGGTASGRPPTQGIHKITWALGAAFIVTSMTLTIIAAQNTEGASVVDRLRDVPRSQATEEPAPLDGELLLPPSPEEADAPLAPLAD
ncbi:preprotein translocase subunit SecG [Aestuariibius sp. 2305UL40-4]|uniref:preprotein translocase subunit SecG n=1 Tax=Aestuariibius violaceus TaxID=3234132 RepID=UPI00345EBC13